MLQVRRRRQWGGPRRAVWQRQGSAERSEKRDREEITKKAARGSQIRFFEQQQLTDRVCERPWARDGEAQGRVDWKRGRWPDAKLEVASAKSDLRKEQQREKREESRERGEKREESREG